MAAADGLSSAADMEMKPKSGVQVGVQLGRANVAYEGMLVCSRPQAEAGGVGLGGRSSKLGVSLSGVRSRVPPL
jgi:hypothetical protein